MTKIPLKPKKWPKYPQTYKVTKIPLKITKIPLKSKNWPKYPWNLKNGQNNPEALKLIKITLNLKNDQNIPRSLKIDKNNPGT